MVWPRGRSTPEDGRKDGDTIARGECGGRESSLMVTLQPSCVRASRKGDWNLAVGGVAVGHGLANAVGGAAAQRGGSDGRDVVGGGCMPLLARAPATNDHPWSIHGGFIRQVRPTRRVVVDVVVIVVVVAVPCPFSICHAIDIGIDITMPILLIRELVCFDHGDSRGSKDAQEGREMRGGGFELEARGCAAREKEEERRKVCPRKRLHMSRDVK